MKFCAFSTVQLMTVVMTTGLLSFVIRLWGPTTIVCTAVLAVRARSMPRGMSQLKRAFSSRLIDSETENDAALSLQNSNHGHEPAEGEQRLAKSR